jgi:hypothetical protein
LNGVAGPGDALFKRAAEAALVPQNSVFTIHVLSLTFEGRSVSVAWIVQQDDRPFVLVDSAKFPSGLERGKSYRLPFTIVNSGGDAGAFNLSVVLSRSSRPGINDPRLARRSFAGLGEHGRIQSEISINVPVGIADGLYYISTLLEPADARDRRLRLHNGNMLKLAGIGNVPAPGSMSISLSWNGDADLDLHVTDPAGETIYYFHPTSASGAGLNRDRQCGGDLATTEVVSYSSNQAPGGKYLISVHHFRSCGQPADVPWKITVDSDRGSQTFTGVIRPGNYVRAAEYSR